MKILHLITGLSRGGAEHMLYKVVSGMDRARFSSSVVAMTPGGAYAQKLMDLDVPVFDLGMRRGWPSWKAFARFREILRQEQPDVIQCWMYHAGVLGSIARRIGLVTVPMIWNIRHSLGDLASEKVATRAVIRLSARISGSPERIIFNSRLSMRQHIACGYPAATSVLIPNGFDCIALQPDPAARARTRSVLNIGADDVAVLHVARLHPTKGHETLMSAIDILQSRSSRCVFLLVGSGVEVANPFFQRWLDRADQTRIRLLGERDDVPELFNAADIACLSSHGEAFPNVLGEAMAVGTPCVSTDVGDAAHIIGDTGLIVPPRSPHALAEAIGSLMSEPAEAAQARRRAARARIQELFSLQSVIERYESLYEQVGLHSSSISRRAG
jgi:glycosyltransferase involved in cell wall biosynthesis